MSSPLCNPKFVEHLKQSKAKTKLRMHLKADRIIDRVYSQVLADLHLFFTFDHEVVTPREVQQQTDGEPPNLSPCTIMQRQNQSLNLTPLDVNTVSNVSQYGDPQIDAFQTSIAQSIVPITNQSPSMSDPINSHSTHQITQHENDMDNSTARVYIKQEVDDPSNVQLESQQNDDSINSSSLTNESSLFPESMILSSDQSLPNTQLQQQLPQPQQLVDIKHDQFDEEECECEECVYGEIEVKEEDNDDSDFAEWFDDEDEESSRPEKRPRIDSTQLEQNIQSPKQSIDGAHANEDKRPNEEYDRMESIGCEVIDSEQTIEHYDHGLHDFDESLVIRQKQNDTNNAIEDEIANEFTTNPLQPNLVQPNRRFQCPHCSKSFTSRSNLEQHVRVHTGERPFACDQCDKLFSQMGNLAKHKLIHQNIKRFHCDQCGKQFVLKIQLDIHLRTHSGEKPYKCRFCEQCFTEMSTRKKHEQAKHLHVKPYRCKVCGLTATTRSSIITHIRVIHFGLPPTIKQQRERNIIDHRDPRELVEKVQLIV